MNTSAVPQPLFERRPRMTTLQFLPGNVAGSTFVPKRGGPSRIPRPSPTQSPPHEIAGGFCAVAPALATATAAAPASTTPVLPAGLARCVRLPLGPLVTTM